MKPFFRESFTLYVIQKIAVLIFINKNLKQKNND